MGVRRLRRVLPLRSQRAARAEPEGWRWLVAGAVAVYAVIVLRTAWVQDDAFITLRTVDNFLHGYGLRWNVDERVQSYTHPLWMLLLALAKAFLRDPFYATLALTLCTSLGAMAWLSFGLAVTPAQGVLAVILLTCSRAFVDYSTSGLENPLSHLLLVLFAWLYFVYGRRRPVTTLRRARYHWAALSLVAGLIALNRSDTLLVVLPCLVEAGVRSLRARGWQPTLRELALGFAPLVLWLAFSLFYYGSLVPNTALAKLGTGIAGSALRTQGLVYLIANVAWDPALVVILVLGAALAISSPEPRQRWLALGSGLYIVYVVSVGGDFMFGRFLTLPAFAMACVVASRPGLGQSPAHALLVGLPILLVFVVPGATQVWPVQEDLHVSGIADERAYFRTHSSLMMARRGERLPSHQWAHKGAGYASKGVKLVEASTIGYLGYYAGPSVHIIDHQALADPFLARLPARDTHTWRIGHSRRALPKGYMQTVQSGRCSMAPRLCAYYEDLSLITRGALFSWKRIVAIVRMNLRLDERLLDGFEPDGRPSAEPDEGSSAEG